MTDLGQRLLAEAGRPASEPLWSRIEQRHRVQEDLGSASVNPGSIELAVELSTSERKALARARELTGQQTDCVFGRVQDLLAASTRPGPAGEQARQAVTELGLVPHFVVNAVPELRQWMAQRGIDLSSAQLFYSGHITHAMVSLAFVMKSLGLPRMRVCAGRHSGDRSATPAIEAILSGRRGNSPLSTTGFTLTELRALRQREAREHFVGVSDKLAAFAHEAAVAEASGRILLANKAGPLLAQQAASNGRVPDADTEGRRRYLMHNAHDARALEPFLDECFVTSAEDSLFKLLEARFVAEASALAASRVVRESWSIPIHQAKIYVLGYGLIGRSLVRAMRRFGLSADSLVVIEPDAARRRQAEAVCSAHAALPEAADRHAVIFNTASDRALDGESAERCAVDTMVFNLASSGLGVDVPSIIAASSPSADRAVQRVARASYHVFDRVDPHSDLLLPSTHDLLLRFSRHAEAERRVRLVNVAGDTPAESKMHALNLGESPWPERFACTTAMAIVMAALRALEQREPGVQRPPRKLERSLIRRLLKTGICAPRPLDPPKTRHYDLPGRAQGQADLDAFRSPPAMEAA